MARGAVSLLKEHLISKMGLKLINKLHTSSLESCLSASASISLNTFVVGAASPMLTSSTLNVSVAPPGITFPAPRSPYPNSGGIVSLRISPTHMSSSP